MQATSLTHKHRHTLERIFQHPASHNLEWKDVISLVEHLGTVQEENNGRLKLTLNGTTEIFHRVQDKKDVSEVQQVLDLRRFLESTGIDKDGVVAAQESQAAAVPQLSVVASYQETIETEQHVHDQNHLNTERNRHAEQQMKTQQHEQNDRNAFPKGLAQEHTKGNS